MFQRAYYCLGGLKLALFSQYQPFKYTTSILVLKVKSDHSSKFFQFKQLEGRSLKNIRASTGFEPVTSTIPVQRSTN